MGFQKVSESGSGFFFIFKELVVFMKQPVVKGRFFDFLEPQLRFKTGFMNFDNLQSRVKTCSLIF